MLLMYNSSKIGKNLYIKLIFSLGRIQMDTENMKNMIILKNLPSNIIDEAMVILKPNVKLKSLDIVDKNKKVKKDKLENSKKYILNEAEMVISNYMHKLENNKKNNIKINKKIEMQCKRLKMISFFLGVMFMASILIR